MRTGYQTKHFRIGWFLRQAALASRHHAGVLMIQTKTAQSALGFV
jgi:hypothetical protein